MIFYRIAYFFTKIILQILSFALPKKLVEVFKLKNQIKDIKFNEYQGAVWFHAASGEIEYCKSVIRAFKEKSPDTKIVVSYSSPSATKLFENIRPSVDLFFPLPWDQKSYLKPIFSELKPSKLIFSRTDLWPELIHLAKKNQVKLGLISYNPKFTFLNSFVLKSLLAKFDFISCIDEKVQSSVKLLVDTKTKVTADGDTRFDQVFYRLGQQPKLNLKSESKILVCGSTWPEDEKVLLPILSKIYDKGLIVVLSPHEIEKTNILSIKKQIESNFKIKVKLLSEQFTDLTLDNNELLIIDKIGYLADAYRFADLAFVGGSFKSKVHSVMEPLCCGLPVLVGPFYQNNPEAVRYLNQFVLSVNDQNELLNKLDGLLKIQKQQVINEVSSNKNSTERVLDLL